MNKYYGKLALILFSTMVGILAIYPPREKLKTGIDLSGGTILVYEVKRESTASGNVNLDESERCRPYRDELIMNTQASSKSESDIQLTDKEVDICLDKAKKTIDEMEKTYPARPPNVHPAVYLSKREATHIEATVKECYRLEDEMRIEKRKARAA
ncbi:MAG: hypothetical protein Q9228_007843 [Teloschistes exilis]